MRFRCSLVLSAALVFTVGAARAQAGMLLAADDPKQIAQLDLAQVMAENSTRWLSVRLTGRARLALISSADLEAVSSGDAWLRALDYATRERVAAPPDPLSVCAERSSFALADSGGPGTVRLDARPALTASSDLELQRALAELGIQLNLARIAEFSAHEPAPYRVLWFDAPSAGGATAAVRWLERGSSNDLPKIRVADLDAVPINLIALAKDAVSPSAGGEADPSEFAVTYFPLSATSDYVNARARWQEDNPERWLVEAVNTAALFDDTVLAGEGAIPSAVFRYFSTLTGNAALASPCIAQVETAHTHRSGDSADFTCAGADDLARTESELDFADVRLTRLFGEASATSTFVVEPDAQRNPRLQATDFETKGCPPPGAAEPDGTVSPGAGMPEGRAGTGAFSTNGSEVDTPVEQTGVPNDGGGCSLWVDTSDDSCNGDSQPSSSEPSSSDACSGDSSSDASSDSCSGDSSSDSANSDSCSGDSNASSNDSSGCGNNDKSGYDGDTCSGNSASSTTERLGSPRPKRKHRLRLSLFMLLGAGLSLPMRRGLRRQQLS
ncbi:MAG: hypothetical protein ABJB12_17360 [Pseudomonadota bacterium]